jgi:hypothetical protein
MVICRYRKPRYFGNRKDKKYVSTHIGLNKSTSHQPFLDAQGPLYFDPNVFAKQSWDTSQQTETADVNLKGAVFLHIHEFMIVYVTQEVLSNFTALLNTHTLRAHLCQLCSYSRTSQHFMKHEGSLPC